MHVVYWDHFNKNTVRTMWHEDQGPVLTGAPTGYILEYSGTFIIQMCVCQFIVMIVH